MSMMPPPDDNQDTGHLMRAVILAFSAGFLVGMWVEWAHTLVR